MKKKNASFRPLDIDHRTTADVEGTAHRRFRQGRAEPSRHHDNCKVTSLVAPISSRSMNAAKSADFKSLNNPGLHRSGCRAFLPRPTAATDATVGKDRLTRVRQFAQMPVHVSVHWHFVPSFDFQIKQKCSREPISPPQAAHLKSAPDHLSPDQPLRKPPLNRLNRNRHPE